MKTLNEKEEFLAFLRKGKVWCGEKKVEWARLKTFDLTKEVIVFDLGVLAFLGAVNSAYSVKYFLYIGAGLAIFSLLLAFVYIWKVSLENINYLQAKYDVISESLIKIDDSFRQAEDYYAKKINFIEGKLRGKEELWDWVQKIAFSLFLLSIFISFIGLII